MKGRKPKPDSLKQLQGRPGHRPLRTGVPFVVATPQKPPGLDRFASQEWDRLTTNLAPILSIDSVGILTVAVDAYSDMRRAQAILRKQPSTYRSKSESGAILIKAHPAVKQKETARRAYHLALAELGCSPVGRARVHRLPEESPEKSGAREFLD